MNIDPACVECIINQSKRVADAIHADERLSQEIVQAVEKMAPGFSFEQSPPEVASAVYEKMAQIAGKEDLYDEVKRLSTQKAEAFIPYLQNEIADSDEPLLTATKVAVARNVIDLAAEYAFDLNEELEKIFHTHFAVNDFERLQEKLSGSKSLLYIADNAGEHIFDKIYIQTILSLYPDIRLTYMTRGNAIINDVTFEEAKEAGFDELCELVSSGVNTPGFVYDRANKASQELFDTADLIITKGMGNYECLSDVNRDNLFFLLKVKCNVVARSLGKNVGDIICKRR
jgi:damage-control phosphatase, subfamily I